MAALAPAVPTQAIEYHAALMSGSADCPTALLSRERDFSSFFVPWTISWSAGKTLVFIDIWAAFNADPVLGPVLRRWRYLRAGTRFELRTNANSYFYGRLRMTWTPYGQTFSDLDVDRYRNSGIPGVEVDANGDAGGALDVPYFSANPSIDQRVSGPGSLGFLQVMVHSPLRCISTAESTSPVAISLMARLVDPVVDGPMGV